MTSVRADGDREPELEAVRRAEARLATDSAQAIHELESLAERGSVASMICLAEAYDKGVGGKPDLAKCEEWFRRASDSGSDYARYALGRIYLARKQNAWAYQLIHAAASNGFSPAQIRLGDMYRHGIAVKRDAQRAQELYERAAAAGNVYGKLRLSSLYMHGPSLRFFSGVSQPKLFLKGWRLWLSALHDAIFDRD